MKLYARLPDGTLVKRQTHHAYTHVVAKHNPAAGWYASSWTRSPERFRPAERRGECKLVPVFE
jgi:hypothetical protein